MGLLWYCFVISAPTAVFIEYEYPPVTPPPEICPEEEWDQRELNPHLLTENAF